MRSIVAALLVVAAPLVGMAGPARAQATCAPVTTDASLLASADWSDLHPDWADGSTVGLGWTLVPYGEAEGAAGDWFLIGDLLDADGGLHSEGVYASVMEWECDVPD